MIANQSSNDALGDWRIVDETLGMVLPDKEPDMNQPPLRSPPPPSPPPLPMSELVASIEAKAERPVQVQRTAVAAREYLQGPLYAHLLNVQVDLSLGGQYICRVIGMKCHGEDQHHAHNLRVHLGNVEHRNYDAALAAAQAEPTLSPSVLETPTPITYL
ncbi:uncharacterized protein FFB20_05258 [Fusarium fujikuroi]|uniref:Uncharacterized protein n=1 Tax=Fusarium fujikuroi TaxID=5127 RepID=A0A2H3RXQ2_FUSFU|nr:uncharacterized protein Y057_10078 [Fusarium fujikuroi]QGI66253.1 hypothetical protein CEK27_010224 [Fusarium fujikuroi]QGI83496.1 hypothetical protein CEK25_010225 [Fusarium fujikuroi]QGI97137.1 hypothetical protein CEK26_010206 [Fusarium fujikuroi]SCN76388.1 uncharacterized protein FFB20_05258 [Fusarium fujikuroi]